MSKQDINQKKLILAIQNEIQFQYGQRRKYYAKPDHKIDPYKQALSCKRTIDLLKKVKRYIAYAI